MNSLRGTITDVEIDRELSLVTVVLNDKVYLYAIVIDSPQTNSYLTKNNEIQVHFKETEVIIGKEDQSELSIENIIKGKIETIEEDPLLSKISIGTSVGTIIAIISTKSRRKLDLKKDDLVWAMVKTNEIMLSE